MVETGYKQIRYITDFTDLQLAKGAMKTAEAYDAPGIGKWRIEVVNGLVHFVFIPGIALAPMLNRDKSGFFWTKMANDTAAMFEEKLPGHKIKGFVE